MKTLSIAFFACALLPFVAGSIDGPDFNLTKVQKKKHDDCRGKDFGTPGDFGFYVFQQSWSAEFCAGKPTFPGCEKPTSEMKANLTIHGLWPNYDEARGSHEWPQCCESPYGPHIDPDTIQGLLNDLERYWPNERDPDPQSLSNSLWQHEWGKHGTCSGLDQATYFKAALGTHWKLGTPTIIHANIGGQIQRKDLESVYTGGAGCQEGQPCKVGLGCTGGKLGDITTCWGKDLQQMDCPWDVLQGSSSCLASDTIDIPSFNGWSRK